MKSVNILFKVVAMVCSLVVSLQVSAEVYDQIIIDITRVEIVTDPDQVIEVDFTHRYNKVCNKVIAYPSVSIVNKPKYSTSGELLEQGLIRISIFEKIVKKLNDNCIELPAAPQTMKIALAPVNEEFTVINMLSSSSDIDWKDIFRNKYRFELPKVSLRP